jgi:glutaminyl-tRNA synthetase
MPNPDLDSISSDFIRDAVKADLASGRFDRVQTRFPPEPNAYLHIGHAKAVWIDYGVAQDFGGLFNLRFDDTNPEKEEQEFVDAIVRDMRWLLTGSTEPTGEEPWGDRLFFASDYFEQMFEWAKDLIAKGLAYVCDLNQEEMRAMRGTLTAPGQNSPYRERSPEENLDLFQRMRAGEFPDGAKTLRAKIDMASPNINLRDPVMYRIRHAHHHRQGDKWCVYPSYDWAHGLEDSIEGVTHSLCTMEYEDHRPLYDWFLDALGIFHPRQIEFSRLNMTHTVMSKRRFIELVRSGHVQGFDDPRLVTLAGLRRRGYTHTILRDFCRRVGVTKNDVVIEMHMLEDCARDELNRTAARVMAVLDPIKVVITNYPEGETEIVSLQVNPENPDAGRREVPFSREIWIDRDDFREDPPPKFFRLGPGREVRLRGGYLIRCEEVIHGPDGRVVELRCTYDPATKGGATPDGRKVKGTIHWVPVIGAVEAEYRLYDHLFLTPDPDEGGDYLANLNPESLKVGRCYVEPSVAGSRPGQTFQFERTGYFTVDRESAGDRLIFGRTVTLRDTWAKIEKSAT